MSNLYETLSIVRTSMLNVIGKSYIEGERRPINMANILEDAAQEINDYIDFEFELFELSEDQLEDLGFEYLDKQKSMFMLLPLWLYPFIPDSMELINVNGNKFVKNVSIVECYGEHWINAGFFYEKC